MNKAVLHIVNINLNENDLMYTMTITLTLCMESMQKRNVLHVPTVIGGSCTAIGHNQSQVPPKTIACLIRTD